MTWLFQTKIAPMFAPIGRPDQRVFRPESSEEKEKLCWKIRWNTRAIGWAKTNIRRDSMGQGTVNSTVYLEELPTQKMIREMFGSMSMLVKMLNLGDSELNMTITATSQMKFDSFGVLEGLQSSINIDGIGELFVLSGQVQEDGLHVRVLPGVKLIKNAANTSQDKALFEKTFPLPSDAALADAMAPQSRLAGLRLGQTWQFQSWRAFPPTNPLRRIEATVIREEMFAWESDVEPVKVVTFTDISGSGITAARKPSSHLWVRRDGVVLKQQMDLGNVTIEFIRQPEDSCDRIEETTRSFPRMDS